MNMAANNLLAEFPDLPRITAQWSPVYIEPIIGSGERITAAIITTQADGTIEITRALREEALVCAFGNKAAALLNIVNLIEASFRASIANGGALEQWVPPVEGVFLGSVRKARSSNTSGIIRQAIWKSASFCALPGDADEIEETDYAVKRVRDGLRRFINEVRELALRTRPILVNAFNAKIDIRGEKRTSALRLGFRYQSAVANFALLDPQSSRRGACMRDIKAKMLDLSFARDHSQGAVQRADLLMWMPDTSTNYQLSDKELDWLDETLFTLHEIGREEGLGVIPTLNAGEAAEHLVSSV